MARTSAPLQCEALEDRSLPSVTLHFNYSLDKKGFFNDPARRALLEKAGDMLTSRLNDTLSAIVPGGVNTWKPWIIDPATGAAKYLSGSTQVPKNTIIVYAGGRDLPDFTLAFEQGSGFSAQGSVDWIRRLKSRGEPGALGPNKTDFAPSLGSISFDTAGTNWHFGETASGLTGSKTDFLSVALHELGHLLGIGVARSWDRLVSGTGFKGANARAANGGPNVPLDGDKQHFAEDTLNPGGVEVAMAPVLDAGLRRPFGAIDFAALKDIGWEVLPPGAAGRAPATASRVRTQSPSISTNARMAYFASLGSVRTLVSASYHPPYHDHD